MIVRSVQSVSLTEVSLHFHHSYYMDGRVHKVEDFLKTRLLDTLTEQINKVTKVLKLPSNSTMNYLMLYILNINYTVSSGAVLLIQL